MQMSDEPRGWNDEVDEVGYSRPAYFDEMAEQNGNIPYGYLPKALVVLQGNDWWFDEVNNCWKRVNPKLAGKWGDECFGPAVVLYGYLPRLSDGCHEERFKAVYGREKPTLLSNWPDKAFNRSDLDT